MSFLTLPQWTAELAEEVVAVEVKVKLAKEAGVLAGIEDAKSRVAVLTGETRDSIGPDGEGGYGADSRASSYLEFGTSDTAPQPFVGPSADKAEAVFTAGIVATIGP